MSENTISPRAPVNALDAVGVRANNAESNQHFASDPFPDASVQQEKGSGEVVRDAIVNVSLIASIVKSPDFMTFVKRFGGQFIIPAIQRSVDSGEPLSTILPQAGGLVGWASKSPMVIKGLEAVDTSLDSGMFTAPMLVELIQKPELLKELANSYLNGV